MIGIADWRNIFALAIITSTTAGAVVWNNALFGGIGPGIGAIAWGGVGFLMLQCCIAELCSTIPYSGGSYGFVRIALGNHSAMVAGLMETCA